MRKVSSRKGIKFEISDVIYIGKIRVCEWLGIVDLVRARSENLKILGEFVGRLILYRFEGDERVKMSDFGRNLRGRIGEEC